MLLQRSLQRTAAIERNARGDAEVGEALAPDTESECVFESLKTGQKAVLLDHDAGAGSRSAGLLKVAHELLHIDRAPGVDAPDTNVRIDHHHGFDVRGQTLQQAADGPRLAPVDSVVEASPAGLP